MLLLQERKGTAPTTLAFRTDILHIAKFLSEIMLLLHSQHVIHSNIKPTNILVDGDGNLKIAGFGHAIVLLPESAKNPPPIDGGTSR